MQVLRRIGLIGDLHCEHEALSFALDQLERLGAECFLQVGDIADGPGDLNATIALLEARQVQCVRGNHDRWLLANQMRELPNTSDPVTVSPASIAFLTSLPVTREYGSAWGNVLLCHGLGHNDMVGVKPYHEGYDLSSNTELQRLLAGGRYRFVLNGHTHRAMLRRFGALSIINAGTLLRDDERSFTYVDFESGELSRFGQPAGQLATDLAAWRVERQVLGADS